VGEDGRASQKRPSRPVTSIQVDATKAVTCGLDLTVQVVDIINGEVLQILRGHEEPVLTVGFDRRMILSISADGQLREWSWKGRRQCGVGPEGKNENMDESRNPISKAIERVNGMESNQRGVKSVASANDGRTRNENKTSLGGALLNRMVKKYARN